MNSITTPRYAGRVGDFIADLQSPLQASVPPASQN
jgi:hypothetical protein